MRVLTLVKVTNESMFKNLATLRNVFSVLGKEDLKKGARTCNSRNAQRSLPCFLLLGHKISVPPKEKKIWEERMQRRRERVGTANKGTGDPTSEDELPAAP